jgi:hypothetical protein
MERSKQAEQAACQLLFLYGKPICLIHFREQVVVFIGPLAGIYLLHLA